MSTQRDADSSADCEVICKTADLDTDTVRAMDSLWANTRTNDAPIFDTLDQVVRLLHVNHQIAFRFVDFEQSLILWQTLSPTSAIVQERCDGQLLRVHLFSRLPTGEVHWRKQVAADQPKREADFTGLLPLLVLIPCFDDWIATPIRIPMQH